MRVTFRAALTGVLLCVLLPTAAVLGTSAYLNGRSTVQDLTEQILEQTSSRIEERARSTFHLAARPSTLVATHLQATGVGRRGSLSPAEFTHVSSYLTEVLRAYPELSMLGVGLEGSGDYCNALRVRQGLLVQQVEGRKRLNTEYLLANGTRRQVRRQRTSYDPRTRPWYRQGRAGAGKPAWTEAYRFVGRPQEEAAIGISCSTLVKGAGGKPAGVVSADFTLEDLSRFLRELRLGKNGFAFVVERRAGGRYALVAHRDPRLLVTQAPGGADLPSVTSLPDTRIARFLDRVRWSDTPREGVRPVRMTHQGVSYLGGYRKLGGDGIPSLLLCMVIPERDLMHRVERQSQDTLLYASVGLLAVLLAGLVLSTIAARWLTYLHREADQIGRLELGARKAPRTHVWEVDELGLRLEQMKAGLRSFSKFVPAELVRSLLARGVEAGAEGERRTLTICFTDIWGFTSIAERLPPEELVRILSEYLDELTAEIQASGGTVDKYTGDGVLAFWGAPEAREDHALAACSAALRFRDRVNHLNERRTEAGGPVLQTRIGIHTGEVVVGTIGSQVRLNYTVMGDAVNIASRMEQLNKTYGTEILISESTYVSAGRKPEVRQIDHVTIRGREQPILIYELVQVADAKPEA